MELHLLLRPSSLLQDAEFPVISSQYQNLQKASLGKQSQQKTDLQMALEI